jgi:hypothetical protein
LIDVRPKCIAMKLFKCQHCGQLLYFENTRCERCGHELGFFSGQNDLLTLTARDNQAFADVRNSASHYRYCANSQYNACNWLIPVASPDLFCVACKLNETIPDLTQQEHLVQWRKLELAKHRLVYTLLRLHLPLSAKSEDAHNGLAFNFLAEEGGDTKIVMGHDEGLITINLAEADEAKRVALREKLEEPYRTLTGHFRHESGHYYWDRLVRNSSENLKNFRDFFGDETISYDEALKRYYSQGAPLNWTFSFVSAYASAHPWEDWAETWAHYLHIIDTLETAYSHGLTIHPVEEREGLLVANHRDDPFQVSEFKNLMALWYPLTVTVNNLNRSMGQPDFYPFVIAPPVVEKLEFIHRLCRATF